jgi:hypothetical protein
MAAKRIQQHPVADTITGDELLLVAQESSTVTLTGTTISALASDNSYNDSGDGFLAVGFAVGDGVIVSGFTGDTGNNTDLAVIVSVTAGKMVVSGLTLVDDSAGESVTITAWSTRRAAVSELGVIGGPSSGGGGSGGGTLTYARLTPMTSQPPGSSFATLDTRNSIAVLDFDADAAEAITWVDVMPEGADLTSGLKIRLHWTATTATSGNCVWSVALERLNTDIDSDSFDTAQTGTGAANGTSGIPTVTEITITTIDSIIAGDGYRLKVSRVATDGSDTMTGDAELICVEVRSAV